MRSDQCQIFTLLSHPTRLTCWIRRASLTTNWSEKMSKSLLRISISKLHVEFLPLKGECGLIEDGNV
jgi:hypothetical protein